MWSALLQACVRGCEWERGDQAACGLRSCGRVLRVGARREPSQGKCYLKKLVSNRVWNVSRGTSESSSLYRVIICALVPKMTPPKNYFQTGGEMLIGGTSESSSLYRVIICELVPKWRHFSSAIFFLFCGISGVVRTTQENGRARDAGRIPAGCAAFNAAR